MNTWLALARSMIVRLFVWVNEEDRVVGGWPGIFWKMLEPLHEYLSMHPAGLGTGRH